MSKMAKYIGASDQQVRWGSCADPRGVLTEGEEYEVERVEMHSMHTKIHLKGIEGGFNSVCFEEIGDLIEAARLCY